MNHCLIRLLIIYKTNCERVRQANQNSYEKTGKINSLIKGKNNVLQWLSILGMNLIWWVIWLFFIFWIFAIPYNIPGQRRKKDSPLDILQKRFASGQITNEEYNEKKRILQNDIAK